MELKHIETCRKNELLCYIRLIEELVAFLIKKKRTDFQREIGESI